MESFMPIQVLCYGGDRPAPRSILAARMPACLAHAGRLSLLNGVTTMTISSTAAVKAEESSGNDEQRADTASDAFTLGVDQQGREYVFSRIRDCVTRLDNGEHETQALNGRPLSKWMAFVDQKWGWQGETNIYSGSTIDHLCDQLSAGLNGGDH